jgi:hypothetical protein
MTGSPDSVSSRLSRFIAMRVVSVLSAGAVIVVAAAAAASGSDDAGSAPVAVSAISVATPFGADSALTNEAATTQSTVHAHVEAAPEILSDEIIPQAPSAAPEAHGHVEEMPVAPMEEADGHLDVSPMHETPSAAPQAATASQADHHSKPNADERACLADLTAQARAATTRFEDFNIAVAEGYVSNVMDPSKTHYPNRAYKRDGVIFDLSKPESLIYITQDDGTKRFVGVLYHTPVGQGPTPCGAATFWHTHGQCIDATGAAVPESKDKTCPAGMQHRDGNVEMMHLWFVPRGQRS